jgi:hypothetical protein
MAVRVTKITGYISDELDLLAPWLQVFLITLKYSAITDLHAFQLIVAHALGMSSSLIVSCKRSQHRN